MLHFLRHIRQKLILQDNVKKYLLYAIGEILLVVIGILIALQVNDWNEQRKLQNQVETYMYKLLEEAEYNVSYLGRVVDNMENNLIASKKAAEMLSKKELMSGLDSIITRGIGTLGHYSSLNTLTSVYDEASNAGVIQHIENDTVRLSINRFISETNRFSETLDYFRRTFINPMDYSNNEYKRVFDNTKYLYSREVIDFEKLASNEEFISIVNRGLRNAIVFQVSRYSLVRSAEYMCDMLAKELNTTCSPEYVREGRREN